MLLDTTNNPESRVVEGISAFDLTPEERRNYTTTLSVSSFSIVLLLSHDYKSDIESEHITSTDYQPIPTFGLPSEPLKQSPSDYDPPRESGSVTSTDYQPSGSP